jgi:hypothetical protein
MLWIGAPVTGVAVPLILAKLGYDEEPEKSELYKKLDTELGFHLSSAHREQIIGIVEKLVAEELAKSATSSNHGLRYRAVSNGILVGPERGDANESLEDLRKFLGQRGGTVTENKGFIQFSEAGNSGLWQTYVKNLTYWDIVHSQEQTDGG